MVHSNQEGITPGSEGPRLRIYTLGQFTVYKDNEVATANFRSDSKAWALLLYLITHSRKPNSLESIYEALWDGDESADPKKKVKNLIHRLRKTIDVDSKAKDKSCVVFSHGCYNWHKNAACRLDVDIFENLCHDGDALREKEPLQASEKYREAIKLYRGVYLPLFTDYDWVITARNYYHQMYLRSVFELLEIYKSVKQFSRIAKLCEKVFLVEQFDEELHRWYLEALLEEGKTAQAKSHYEYITAQLYHEFGTKPSKAFQHIYRAIKNIGDSTEYDFNHFKETLKVAENNKGALSCDFDTFAMLSQMEKRRIEREENQLFVVVLTVTGADYRSPPPAELGESMANLNLEVANNLRSADIYCRLNESQIAILLKAYCPEKVDNIIRRIKKNAKQATNCRTVVVSNVYPASLF